MLECKRRITIKNLNPPPKSLKYLSSESQVLKALSLLRQGFSVFIDPIGDFIEILSESYYLSVFLVVRTFLSFLLN